MQARRLLPGLVGTAIVLTVFTAGAAYAHYAYGAGTVYESSIDCTWIRSEVSHGDGNGYYKGNVEVKRNFGDMHCGERWSRPAGNVRIHLHGMKRVGSTWAACWGTSPYWKYNSSSTSKLESIVRPTKAPACGAGTYRTDSSGAGYNGAWHGGTVLSGEGHRLPT